jgi:Primosomal protein N'' (replication factor Y) - superfamily II helicase
MELACPVCHGSLDVQGESAHCAQCDKNFRVEARCPDCQQPLEILKACGAVDYFCQNGHGLISKKRVVFTATPN